MSNIIYNQNQSKSKYLYIYKITNKLNNKIYIGQRASTVEPSLDTKYMGSGIHIKRSIKNHGKENFIKEIIEVCESKEQLNQREIYWIGFYLSRNPIIGYNISKGGDGGINWIDGKCPNIGLKRSEETKNKIRLIRINQPSPNKGKKMSDEQKLKLSETHKGKPSPMIGKHHSEETKLKISISNKGKISWNKGKQFSDETKLKMCLNHADVSGKNNPNYGKKQKTCKCPYCSKIGSIINMKRWHFENCKFKP